MVYAIQGGGGIDFSQADSSAQFPLGLAVQDNLGGSWCYVEAGAALTAYNCYKMLVNGVVGSSTAKDNTVDDNAANFVGGFPCCWPQQSFDSGDFGWVQTATGDGTLEAFTVTGISAGDKLYTSATAGAMDNTAAAHWGIIGQVIAVDANATGTIAITVQVAAPARVDTVVANAAA